MSSPIPTPMINMSALDAIMHASIVVQLTLVILIVLSVMCWGVAISKYHLFKKLHHANDLFINKFWKVSSLDSLYEDIDSYANSSAARVFKSAYLEMKKIAESPLVQKTDNKIQLTGIDNLERALRKSMDNEVSHLESHLTILATTGSTGPFIGLFGTVWGIMNSFQKIGQTGAASLAIVAPGISEALIATAIGLAAAIPAVIIYNHYIAKIKKEEMLLSNFSADFLNIVKRNFFKEV